MQVKRYLKSIQNHTKNKYLRTYYLLIVLRVCLVFVPQLGYIHPDEFFQTTEVIMGEQNRKKKPNFFYPLITICFLF